MFGLMKSKKKELDEIEKKIESRRKMDVFLKTDSCDWCLQDLWNWKIDESKLETPVAEIYFGYKRVLLCQTHLKELSKWAGVTAKEVDEERENKIPKMKEMLI